MREKAFAFLEQRIESNKNQNDLRIAEEKKGNIFGAFFGIQRRNEKSLHIHTCMVTNICHSAHQFIWLCQKSKIDMRATRCIHAIKLERLESLAFECVV